MLVGGSLHVRASQGGGGGPEDVDGMSIFWEVADDFVDTRVDLHPRPKLRVEAGELGSVRQLSVQDKVGGLLERSVLRQVLNRVSSIDEGTVHLALGDLSLRDGDAGQPLRSPNLL